jgi:hypothetical protein
MPRRIALIVGVSQYESRTGLHSLSAPVNDAQRVYDVLSEYGDFDMLYPLPLADGKVGSSGKVYAHDLQAKLGEMLSPSTDEEVDLAVFYFSGHGVSERGQVVYLSTSDERLAIALPWLAELVKTSAVKNVCIWLDCCHSGEVLKFTDLGERGFCVVAASHAEGEALARADGNSLLTEILCKALTPRADCQEIQVKHFINELEQQRRNLPQQVLCRWSDDTPFTLTQLNGEVAEASSSPRKPARGWVWHSTDASIAAGQISVLSVLETFCALGLYGWLAFHFEHQWWLLISAVATPVILLRSCQAKILGIKLLRQYWQEKDIKGEKISKLAKAIIISIMIVNLFIAYYLSYPFLPTDKVWTIFRYLFVFLMYLIPSALIEITLLSSQFMEISNLLFRLSVYTIKFTFAEPLQKSILVSFLKRVVYILVVFSIFYVTDVLFKDVINEFLKSVVAIAALLALMYAIIIAYRIIGAIVGVIFVLALDIPILMMTSITAALGIFLRGLFIRFFCNLINLKSGVLSLPENWKETLWMIDFTLPPELLPGAAQVDANLSVSGLFRRIKEVDGYIEKWLVLMLILILYIPAIIWRWSLKSTLWTWWLLVLVLRSPFEGKSLGEVRDIAAIRVNGLGKWLPLLAVVVMLWLSSGYFSPEDIKSLAELGGDTISKLLDKLLTIAPPPLGLRHWALWLVCGLSIIMWWLSDRLQIMHKKVLEEEDALDGLTKERRNLFLQRAHRLERWHTARVVSFILLGYSFALYLANEWYPLELGRFVPAWLLGWL